MKAKPRQSARKGRGNKSRNKTSRRSARSSGNAGSARGGLLSAGKRLFARKGLSGTSIRDIAQEAGLNSSLISYYFASKEGLYKECIREIGDASLQMAEQILRPPQDVEDFKSRLLLFLDNLFRLFLEDRDTGLLLIREYDRQHSPAGEIFKETLLEVIHLLNVFFRAAQVKKLIAQDRDPFTLASLLFGCVTSQMRMDHLLDKAYHKSLKDPAEKLKVEKHIVALFLA